MPLSRDEIMEHIHAHFPDAECTLIDLAGDNDHWHLTIKSAAFHDKTRIEQHQLVYKAFGSLMGDTLHALKLTTLKK